MNKLKVLSASKYNKEIFEVSVRENESYVDEGAGAGLRGKCIYQSKTATMCF